MYRPGTLVTLKDGRVYRTSRKVLFPCNKCMNFYAAMYKPTPCSMLYTGHPFEESCLKSNKIACCKLFGRHQFPKLITLCGKQDN